jgi:Tfp pilus assembly protein PilX
MGASLPREEGNMGASLPREEGNTGYSLPSSTLSPCGRGQGEGYITKYPTMRHLRLNSLTDGRRGAALVLALLILALVTAMGVFAATRSSMEQRIAANSKDNTAAFFTAEGGIRHGMALLKPLLMANMTTPPTWSFYMGSALNYYCQGCDTGAATIYSGAWLTGGVTVVNRTFTMGNYDYNYTVYVWNNDESGKTVSPCPQQSAISDCDGVIYMRSVGKIYFKGTTNPAGPESIQEATINANAGQGIGMLSGLSQEFANEGKTSSAVDVKEITTSDLSTHSATTL